MAGPFTLRRRVAGEARREPDATRRRPTRTAALGLALIAVSCLNVGGDPDPTRSFRPLSSDAPPAALERRGLLDLRPVTAAAHIEERMVFRASEVELGFQDDLLWAERPEECVERALARALFESGAYQRSSRSEAIVLHVDLRAFEEDRTRDVAIVVIGARLQGAAGAASFEREYRAQEHLQGEGPEAVARAIGRCIDISVGLLCQDLEAHSAEASSSSGA